MKKVIIIFSLIIVTLISIFIFNYFKLKKYEYNITYLNTDIFLTLYSNNEKQANKVFKDIENIYQKYDNLINDTSSTNNLYNINNNLTKDESITVDKDLANIINYGLDIYTKTSGLVDISKGNINSVWMGYRSSKVGIPSLEELKFVNYNTIDQIELNDNNIKNNNLNIDLNLIIKSYVTDKVVTYLKQNKINSYALNVDNIIVVGQKNNYESYKLGLEDPDDNSSIYKVINIKNKAVASVGLEYYEYDNKRYYNIINPKTLFPPDYVKSVTVVGDDIMEAEFLATYLFLLPIEEGKKILENYNVEAIWCLNDNTYITTDEFNKYVEN